MNKAFLIVCYTADPPHRTGSYETVRWHGSEHGRVGHQPNRLVRDCEGAWF